MNIILFDSPKRENLYPIAQTRPISEIRVGMLTIKEKWDSIARQDVSYLVPEYLATKFPVKSSDLNLYVNASLLPEEFVFAEIIKLKPNQKLVKDEQLLAFVGEPLTWTEIENTTLNYEVISFEKECVLIKNTWDVIAFLDTELKKDLNSSITHFSKAELPVYVTSISPENIYTGKNVKIGACILNASEGIILIDDDAEIMDGAILKGPVYIGKHSVVKMGAKIYGSVCVGPFCKVGGEIIESVFQGYSNKGHDGFLGHSYLGEWCNLGADTNSSNMKNTYEKVRLWNYATERFEKTGLQFLGLIMGDHSKTGINTMLNTGTVLGVACNAYGAGFPRNFFPDFTQGSSRKTEIFSLENVCKMAEAMMSRRKIEFNEMERNILSAVFENTKQYRK